MIINKRNTNEWKSKEQRLNNLNVKNQSKMKNQGK